MEKKIYGVVYGLIDGTNDFEYIGQTTRSVERRFKEHAKCKKNRLISNAIRNHGAENFVIAILKVCYSQDELDFWEMHFIKSRDSMAPNGYNLKEGGKGGKMSKETCKKLSVSHTGKKRSPEAIAKTAMSRRGIPLSLEHRAKLSVANTGKKLSKEHRAKIGVKLKGVPKSPEHRAKIGASQKGKL